MDITKYKFSDKYIAPVHEVDDSLNIYTYLEDGVININKNDVIALAQHFNVTESDLSS